MSAQAVRDVSDPAPRTLPGRENWWVQPVAVAVGFTIFIIYSFWSVAFGSAHHTAGPYLSPYYSPVIKFAWWPLSSAFLVAWVPLIFRASCYYYRKAYYRAYFWDPPACAIREPRALLGIIPRKRHYTGETKLPWIANNFHRFALYLALIILGFLWYDVYNAFYYHGTWYVGAGTILMLLNVVFLTGYTFSCHALRHLVGGSIDCYSCAFAGTPRHGLWGLVSKINPYHGAFAWFSLVSVGVVDIYIHVISNVGNCFGVHTGC